MSQPQSPRRPYLPPGAQPLFFASTSLVVRSANPSPYTAAGPTGNPNAQQTSAAQQNVPRRPLGAVAVPGLSGSGGGVDVIQERVSSQPISTFIPSHL